MKTNKLLHLADNLVCLAQALDHLQALLASADCVVALLEQIVEFLCAVHLLQKLALHLFFREPVESRSVKCSMNIHVVQLTAQGST